MSSVGRIHHRVELVYDPRSEAWSVYLGSVFLGKVTECDGSFRATGIDATFATKETAAYALAAGHLANAF
jgi:hypothetical protein